MHCVLLVGDSLPGLPGGGGLPLRRGLGEYETLYPGRRGRLPLREKPGGVVLRGTAIMDTIRFQRWKNGRDILGNCSRNGNHFLGGME